MQMYATTYTHTHTHTHIRLNNWANKRVTTALLPAPTHCLPSPENFFGAQLLIGLSVWIWPLTLEHCHLSYPPARAHAQTQRIYEISWHRLWRGWRVMRWVSGWRSGVELRVRVNVSLGSDQHYAIYHRVVTPCIPPTPTTPFTEDSDYSNEVPTGF